MFVRPTHLSDKEVEQYRKIMDPLGKMADDVFEDACRMEHVISKESFEAIKNHIK